MVVKVLACMLAHRAPQWYGHYRVKGVGRHVGAIDGHSASGGLGTSVQRVAAAVADGSAFAFRPEYDNPTGQEDFLRQTVTLAEEFLTLLIIILGQFHHHHWCGGSD